MTFADEEKFREKIVRFREQGAQSLHIVYDFDRTLTVSHPGTGQDVTTWQILGNHLSKQGQERYEELLQKYRKLELNDTLTEQDAVKWWEASLQLFVDEQVNVRKVEEDFLARASVRPGTAELFAACAQRSIPSIIMSAGIRDVIEIWARAYGLGPSLVLSTALKLDGAGRIVGWDRGTLIHVLNKHEAGHKDLTAIRSGRPNVIVVGDGMGDADMVTGEANALRIRIFDPRSDEIVDLQTVREKTFTKFDALIESGTFYPLLELLKIICPENY